MPISPPHVNNSRPFYTGGFEMIITSEADANDVLNALICAKYESKDGENSDVIIKRLRARLEEIEELNAVVRKR